MKKKGGGCEGIPLHIIISKVKKREERKREKEREYREERDMRRKSERER